MCIDACKGKYSQISNYYEKNRELHKRSVDSLTSFCKKNNCRVVIRKSSYNNEVSFVFWPLGNSEGRLIKFDSLFRRSDHDPVITASTVVPVNVISTFKNSPYLSLRADSSQVFFGYKYYPDGNFQYGILINKNKSNNDCIRILDSSACIHKGIIP